MMTSFGGGNFGGSFTVGVGEQHYSNEERLALMRKIEFVTRHVLEQIAKNHHPVIEMKSISRVGARQLRTERISFFSEKSRKRFAIIMKLLDEIHRLLDTNTVATKRDLFYRDVTLYESQVVVDRNLDAIARTLAVPRWRLNVTASSKGLVVGDLSFFESIHGGFVDCQLNRDGTAIPTKVHHLCNLRSSARFVLLVEKDAIFQYLVNENFIAQFDRRCILITGKGYADLATRQLLRRLRTELNLPIFALMDADPHGLDIFLTYSLGTPSTLFNDLLTVPDLQLIGVMPHEISALNLPNDQLLPLTSRERALLTSLTQRVRGTKCDFLLPQIDMLQQNGVKAEIQALYCVGPRYLAEKYLPNKISDNLPPPPSPMAHVMAHGPIYR